MFENPPLAIRRSKVAISLREMSGTLGIPRRFMVSGHPAFERKPFAHLDGARWLPCWRVIGVSGVVFKHGLGFSRSAG